MSTGAIAVRTTTAPKQTVTLEEAVAALLLEMGRADEHLDYLEGRAAVRLLRRYFAIPTKAAVQLLSRAAKYRRNGLTAQACIDEINASTTRDERTLVFSMIYRVMFADRAIKDSELKLARTLRRRLKLSSVHDSHAYALAILADRMPLESGDLW